MDCQEKETYKIGSNGSSISYHLNHYHHGNGNTYRPITCTHNRRKTTRRFVIVLLFIVTEATICSSSASSAKNPKTSIQDNQEKSSKQKQDHYHDHQYQLIHDQQSPLANSTGATNNYNNNNDQSNRIAQNVTSEAASTAESIWESLFNSMLFNGQQTRGLIDHYISEKDFGKLFSLGLNQVIRILFDNDTELQQLLLNRWPNNLRAEKHTQYHWLNCNKLNSNNIGDSIVDFLKNHQASSSSTLYDEKKKRSKRDLTPATDDVELFGATNNSSTDSLADKLNDKLVGQGSSQKIKSVNPIPRAETNMKMIQADESNQDYLYDDHNQHNHHHHHHQQQVTRPKSSRSFLTSPQLAPNNQRQRHPAMQQATNRANPMMAHNSHNSPQNHWKSPKLTTVPESMVALMAPTSSVAPTDQPYAQNTDTGVIESPLVVVDPMRYHNDKLASLNDDLDNGNQSGDGQDKGSGSGSSEPTNEETDDAITRPTSNHKTARASRRRQQPLESTQSLSSPLSSDSDPTNLSAQVPAPEQNPLKVKRGEDYTSEGDDSSPYETRPPSDQQDNIVPQVGDQLVLDHSAGKKQQQTNTANQMSALLKEQRQLKELMKMIDENGSPSTANSKGNSKRRHHNNNKQQVSVDNDNYAPSSKEHRLQQQQQQQPISSPSISSVSLDSITNNELRPIDNMVRTNAPYAAIDPNIMKTGNSDNYAQQQQQQQQQQFMLPFQPNEQPQLQPSLPLIELASENNNNNNRQFKGSTSRFSTPMPILSLPVQGSGGKVAAYGNYHYPQQQQRPTMMRPQRMAPADALLTSQIQEFFGGSGAGNNFAPVKPIKHNKRAISFDGGQRSIQFHQSNQNYPYREPGGNNGRFAPMKQLKEAESKQSSILNGQYVLNQQQRPMMTQNYLDNSNNNLLPLDMVQSDQQYGIPPSVNPQNQLVGLLRAAPPMLSSQQQFPAQPSRRQAPLAVNNGNTAYRMPVISSSSFILPNFSTSSSSSSSNPLRFSRALNNTNSGYNHAPMRNSMNAAYQHRIGRVANSGNSNYDDGNGSAAQASVPTTSTSDPMWSDTQNQEEDYQQSPQTIQITAVPNGGFVNGFNRFNGLNGFNGLAGLGFPGAFPGAWGGGGPWDGRQVLLVNRQPQGVGGTAEWRSWMLPVAIILALPLILGALFVPVFLKSVMFLIQILQMLGLLMPPSQLAQHLTSGSHNTSLG